MEQRPTPTNEQSQKRVISCPFQRPHNRVVSDKTRIQHPQQLKARKRRIDAVCCSMCEEAPCIVDAAVPRSPVRTIHRTGSSIGSRVGAVLGTARRHRRGRQGSLLFLLCLWVMVGLSVILSPAMASAFGSSSTDQPLWRTQPQRQQQPQQRPPLTSDQERKVLLRDPRLNPECVLQRQPSVEALFGMESVEHAPDYVMGSCSNEKIGNQKRELGSAGGDHSMLARRDWSIPQGVKAINMPLSGFRSMAVVNSSTMLCNGRADICDLRYNQVTYPGTHNSATSVLQYDCSTAINTCLETTTVCAQQAQNCTQGWEVRCTAYSNSCLKALPNWLHWLCGAFSSACDATETFCLGWEDICTSSLEVCTLWGSACSEVIPAWAIPCFWENQPDHTVAQQLTDGIRFLDLGTCLTNNNTQVVMCHGYGSTRAIGVTLDSVLSAVVSFLVANPYEVLTIEFNEFDGSQTLMSQALVAKILQYFTLPTGELLMWPRSSLSEAWPTLREMILANKRLIIFMSDTYYSIPDPVPTWANQKDTWKLDGFTYAGAASQPDQLNASYYSWCEQGPPTDGSYILWQQIDINLGIVESDIIASLKQGEIPQLCIGPLAVQTNGALLDALANFCYTRWPYWFRIRVNNYWVGDVFKMTDIFNDNNVARVKAGDSITPY